MGTLVKLNKKVNIEDASSGVTAGVTSDGRLKTEAQITGNITIGSEVEIKNDSGNPVPVNGTVTEANSSSIKSNTADYSSFQSDHRTLTLSTDTTITFAQQVRLVRITNWDTANRVLVKNGAITSDSDSTASRVGFAPTTSVPNSELFPITTTSIHVRSAAASEVTIEGFY